MPQEGGIPEVNMMEALVGLLYGEIVHVPAVYLATLSHYAHMLGLSHQVCACLEMRKAENSIQLTENNTSNQKNATRKKHNRKPILIKSFDQRKVSDVKQVEQVSEVNLTSEAVQNPLPVSLQSKQSMDYSLSDTLGVKVDCENSILELSMLCSDVPDMNVSTNSNWAPVPVREELLNYEHQSDSQIQDSNTNACSFENSPSLEVIRDITIETPMEPLNIKMESISNADVENDGNIHSTNVGTSDILSLVVNAEQEVSVFCSDTQQLQHQKKQQKQKSIGKGLVCAVCGSSFQRCGDLVKHVQHMQHFTSQCPLCFVQIREPEGQRLHFALHDQELPFFCMYCELRFRTRAALTMHTPKHSTTKPFVCSECGRGFKWRHALQAHLYTHSPTSRVLCDICGFSSKYVSSFKAHLVQHSGRAFPCPHPGCAFTSNRKTHLNDHLATHSKTRVHQCEVCGHSFSHAKNMRRHMRLHAPPSNRLTCTVISKLQCNFRTTRPDKLRDHLTKKHNLSRHSVPSDPLAKVLGTSSSTVANSDDGLFQNQSLGTLPGIDGIKSKNETEFTSIVQEPTTNTLNLNRLHHKSGTSKRISNVTVEKEKNVQVTNQVCDSQLGGHSDVCSEQETFSVLVTSPDIVQLADIQTLENHAQQSVKQQTVTELADSFPSRFLVEHGILLGKSDSSVMNESQQLESGNMSSLQNNLITPSDHKLRLSVNGSIQNQGNLDLVTSTHVETMSYSNNCAFSRSEESVLEVMAPSGDIPGAATTNQSGMSLMAQETLQKKSIKQEHCMESLNILEFMLDNVTD
nr:myoneurin-like isoform X2 [Procambarus clarkii]